MQTLALADFSWGISLVSCKTYSADYYLVLAGSGSAPTDRAVYFVLYKVTNWQENVSGLSPHWGVESLGSGLKTAGEIEICSFTEKVALFKQRRDKFLPV